MKKKIINSALFFTILYWLLIYFFIIKKGVITREKRFLSILIIIFGNLILISISKYLIPIFEFILKIARKIGSIMFGIISTIVYFFILTPIAIYKKLRGHKLLKVKFEKEKTSYFENWEISKDIEKQF